MSLHLVFANRVEPLVSSLSETLDSLWVDLASPPDVVVPSPSVARWLKLRLCERRAALLNLPTPTLEAFLWRALEPEGRKMLRGPALTQALVPLLMGARLEDPRYASARDFLVRDGVVQPRRRLQLAQELARLFLEYGYNRPGVWKDGSLAVGGVDETWPTRPYFGGTQDAPGESWQRDLWGAVFAEDGVLHAGGWRTLPQLHRQRCQEGWVPEGGPVLLFMVDTVSHFHRNLIMHLSTTRDVHLFLQNPCAEFWEDLDTSRRMDRRKIDRFPRLQPVDYQAEVLADRLYPAGADDTDPLLLKRWGDSARANISLWSSLANHDIDLLVEAPVGDQQEPTTLSLLQQTMTQRHPGPGVRPLELQDGRELDALLPADSSVILLACPERGREMEAVRDQILEWLSQDPDRSPSDCLVLLPDPARHRTEIRRVFGGLPTSDPGWIPWTFLGGPGRESRFARGVESLGELLLQGMDRARVFALFRNPLCQRALGVDSQDVQLWERWAEGAGMLRGWDAHDRKARGDRDGWDTHTFRAGIVRLYASRLASGELNLPLKSAGPEVRVPGWRDFDSSPAALEGFVGALERLHADLAGFESRIRDQDLPEISASFLALCEAWLDPQESEEEQIRRSWRQGMELLSLQKGRTEEMGLEELVDTAKGFLPDELPGSARAFAGALTFAPLRIGNLVPHGLVVVAGLEADVFPRTVQKTPLDLLGAKRILGDADPTQGDRHAFLSALVSARSRLVLSWRCEDLQKDREIDASSVLADLKTALATITESVAEQSLRLLAREPGQERKGRPTCPVESWSPLDAVSPEAPRLIPAWARLEAEARQEATPRLSLTQIRDFAENPFLRHLKRVLGMDEDDIPETLEADEALQIDALHAAGLKRGIFEELLSRAFAGEAPDPEGVVDRHVSRGAWEGWSPEGELLVRETAGLRRWAKGIAERIAVLPREGWTLVVRGDLSLGLPGHPPALELAGAEVVGPLGRVLVKDGQVRILALARMDGSEVKDPRRRLEGWIHAAALCSAGHGAVDILYLSRDLPKPSKGGVLTWECPEQPTGDHGAWFEGLVRDCAAGGHEFLPFRPFVDGRKILGLDELREKVDEDEYADALTRLFDPFLPGEEARDASLLEDLVARRLGPLLDKPAGKDGASDGDRPARSKGKK